jgi:hypothetical protein
MLIGRHLSRRVARVGSRAAGLGSLIGRVGSCSRVDGPEAIECNGVLSRQLANVVGQHEMRVSHGSLVDL